VKFQDGANAIAGCSAVVLASGKATCTTAALASGAHAITGVYSGDTTYGAGMAGPITQTIGAGAAGAVSGGTGSAPTPAGGKLTALSTRMQVLTGDNVLIGGFIIGGTASKTVVVRARGPSLAGAGVSNGLANPSLTLVRAADQAVIAANDDWGSNANAAQIASSGFAPSDPRESAVLVTLPPGAYTAIVSGAGGTTGVGIVEVLEVDHPEIPLSGISTRGQVLTGDGVMIGGFVITGTAPQTVIVRARGPSLAQAGVANALANPSLQLIRAADQTVVGSNDDWGSAANAAQVAASGYAPGDPHEAALLVTLPPGAYTALVSGSGGVTGVGIVEVLTIP
jgi:hypothetical protein